MYKKTIIVFVALFLLTTLIKVTNKKEEQKALNANNLETNIMSKQPEITKNKRKNNEKATILLNKERILDEYTATTPFVETGGGSETASDKYSFVVRNSSSYMMEIKEDKEPLVFGVKSLNPTPIAEDDISVLERIVEAECTGGDIASKKNVASVILNRVDHPSFADSVTNVVFQGRQFSPTIDGRYWSVVVTNETKQAVNEVLQNGRTNDALYFANISAVKNEKIKEWFKTLNFLYIDDIGHSFYN